MSTFQKKLQHACHVFSVTVDDVCKTTKISPFCMELHATGQRNLGHHDMVLLCQYFDLMDDYFTNDNIRYIDEDILPDRLCKLLSKAYDEEDIMCYEVINKGDPDLTSEQLAELFEFIDDEKNE